MVRKQSRQARREAARRASQRRQRIGWASAAAVILLAIGYFVAFSGGSDNQAAALDFELETNTGETVSLSDYRGQPVAVVFMHTF